jgi:phage terminase small subunit
MPALKNPRREKFAQAVAAGTGISVAYREAGYRSQGRAAEAGAARLASDGEITRRITELAAGETPSGESSGGQATIAEPGAARAAIVAAEVVTICSIIRELEDARQLAMEKMQPAPAVSATLGKAKIAGLILDKAENRSESSLTFEGTDTDAARRIAFVLCLAAVKTSGRNEN